LCLDQLRESAVAECEHFVECVRTGIEPRTDGMQGLAVVSVLEAATDSLQHGGRRVGIDLPTLAVAAPGAELARLTPAQLGRGGVDQARAGRLVGLDRRLRRHVAGGHGAADRRPCAHR